MATARTDIAICTHCGVRERIELLDSQPSAIALQRAGGNRDVADFDRLVCIACAGPTWEVNGTEQIALSIAPRLAEHYRHYLRAELTKATAP